MAKDYLNRKERETMAVLLLLHGALETYLEHNAKHMSSQERKFCKMAMAFMLKFYGHAVNRVGAAEANKVTDIATKEMLIFSSQSVIDTRDKVVMDQDSFADLAEGIIEGHCRSCRKAMDQIQTCKIREVLLTADIPPADPYDGCPYRMKGQGGDRNENLQAMRLF